MGSSSSPCFWPHCPPPPHVLLSLQQKSTRCAQSAYHYPPGRAVPARLGCSGQSSGGSSCTHSARELWFGPHYCTHPHAGTRLPVGNPYPFLPSLVDMTVRGWVGSQTTGMGALHFGMRRNLWLAVGTASLGPSGKKDPGWCMGTLPGASLQTVSLCSFLGYSNCPTFPKGSSGVSQAQQAQCWPPAWLKLYIYLLWPY